MEVIKVKLALFADGSVGNAVLDWILGNYANDLCLLVTTESNSVTKRAITTGVPHVVFRSESQLLAFAEERSIKPDLGLLAWWPHILRKGLLSLPHHGFVNTHPSLLPFNRGKHYNFWAIVEKAPFGVSLHVVEPGVDCGAIVAQRRIPYDWLDTGETLFQKAQAAMVELVMEIYPELRTLDFERVPQDLTKGSFHHSSELEPASQIMLNQNYQAEDLINRLRARTFPGRPACWFEADGSKYEIRVDIRRVSP